MTITHEARWGAATSPLVFLTQFLVAVLVLLTALAIAPLTSSGAAKGGHVSVVGGVNAPRGLYSAVGAISIRDAKNVPEDNYLGDAALAFCSSTLIAPSVVLTAAHCLHVGRPYRHPTVIFGKDKLTDEAPGIRRRVKSIAVNPHYSDRSNYGDVGLAFLSRPIDEIVPMPIGLPGVDADPTTADVVASAGWGKSKLRGLYAAFGFAGPRMKMAWGNPQLTDACRRQARPIRLNQLCMTGGERWGSVCYGDSGGPLVLLDDSGAEATYGSRNLAPQRLIGVNSAVVFQRESQACTKRSIDVFQSMAPSSPFNSWVRRTLADRGLEISP